MIGGDEGAGLPGSEGVVGEDAGAVETAKEKSAARLLARAERVWWLKVGEALATEAWAFAWASERPESLSFSAPAAKEDEVCTTVTQAKGKAVANS